jgi:AAHS family 4-hydroxybenzoate transporter-like MFS transporter
MHPTTSKVSVDLAPVLDEGRWTGYLKFTVFLSAVAVVFDGADLQLLALAIPSLMAEWSLPRAAFAPLVAIGMVGMMFGGAAAGVAGDRFGRKSALIFSIVVFALSTLGMSRANGIAALEVLRFLAGIGLGGAIPNAAALASEYVPRRHRPFAVTLAIVCVPLGGILAAYAAGQVLPAQGWRALFVFGGLAPLAFAVVLLWLMPESPRFLIQRPARWPQLAAMLRRMGHEVPADAVFFDSREQAKLKSPLTALFAPDFRRDTISLWLAFVSCLLAVYLCFNWLPSLLAGAGLNGSNGLLAFNLGGVAGAVTGALLITRLGSKPVMLSLAGLAVVATAVFAFFPIAKDAPGLPIWTMLIVSGAMINGMQVTLYALTAHVYPVGMRATGVGSAASFGRIGGVLSSYVGAWAIQAGGSARFFVVIAVILFASGLAIASVRRHVAASARD